MRREYLLGVLLFAGLWGMSEAVLGGALYAAGVPHASVLLTVVALAVLTLARSYFPQKGTGTLIAACAMLYKFLNSPFFGCHLLGILATGVCYDLVSDVLKVRSKAFGAAAATYLNCAAFAVMITYVFRYNHWVQGGLSKVLAHIAIGGTMAALACAFVVPLVARLSETCRGRVAHHSPVAQGGAWYAPYGIPSLVAGGTRVLTLGLWAFPAVMCALSHSFVR